MPQYQVTVIEISDHTPESPLEKNTKERNVFSQIVSEFNLPKFVRALNPETRKRRVASAKKEGS